MNSNCNDSGSLEGDMNIDNIFFYEDNNNLISNNQDDGMSLASQSRTLKSENDQMEINDQVQVQESGTILKHKRVKDHHHNKYTQIKVNVGIDEDLKMILEMVKSKLKKFI